MILWISAEKWIKVSIICYPLSSTCHHSSKRSCHSTPSVLRGDFFFSPLKFSIDREFSLMALDCYCHSRNTKSRCLRTTAALQQQKKILFAHLKYHECHQIYQCIDWSKWEVRSCGIAWGLPAFPLEEGELVSTYSGASLDTRACRTFIQRCACRVECLKSPLGTDEVWFECWAEKKIDWMVDIDSSKSTSKGWLLSLCWHMCYGCRFMLVR